MSSTNANMGTNGNVDSKALRSIKSSLPLMVAANNPDAMVERTSGMNERASKGTPLTSSELDDIIHSLQNLSPADSQLDFAALRSLLSDVAHISHKDWAVTGANSVKLQELLLPSMDSPQARQLCHRILDEGNWDGAMQFQSSSLTSTSSKEERLPWAVLVTGVNGIRKTTSIYQDWFPALLQEALVCPPEAPAKFDAAMLPCGSNAFFRQLDHMIATLCNEDFIQLYALTSTKLGDAPQPSKDTIQAYSDLKAAIFTRYRTLSELFGVALLRHAQTKKLSCMLETSGRDVAMFHYIDQFFPAEAYRKLALHFQVNDLTQAQTSVDSRMVTEILAGISAMQTENVQEIILANAGGPYGSEVLAGVQAASDKVWAEEVVSANAKVGQDWYKATIQINAFADEPWTAQAVLPDGSLGTVHEFIKR